ncbi:OmpA family protein [Nocardia aurea]|uniref:OmpA family protein n=1 Tax=Nocardia aurea TaxID=2144174 RepID=UPI001300BC9A|nr:OmpA family protein [Nocardia aurea]
MPHSPKSQNSLRSFCCPLRLNIPPSLVLFLVFLLLVIGLVAGCGSSAPLSSVRSVTLVVTATSAEPRPVLPESMVDELTSMAKRSKRKGGATVRVVTSLSGEVRTTDLTPVRPNGQVQHAAADADRQIHSAIDKLSVTLGEAASTTPGLSVLPLLDRAAEIPDADIHVISSGISTEAPMDFRVIGWNTNPASIIDSIARQGQIPNLTGRHVTFHGLGRAGGSQPSLPPFARTMTEQVWVGICERAGAASCTVTHDAPTATAPVATMPVPVVPVPEAITRGGCPVWLNLSDAVLHFAGGSAALPVSADGALRPVVEATSRCAIQAIDITGHIADTGDGDDHNDLAGRRARAVADRLLTLGLPSSLLGAVSGHGAREPVIPNFTGGVFDESKAQQNRRVEIVFHQPGR